MRQSDLGGFPQKELPKGFPDLWQVAFLRRETPPGSPVAYGGKPSYSTGLTAYRTFR
ncbi:hypothetical protein [Nostoc parmelioides]|uniref:hypothetical protein n=1 Tax=Nostoc parmelioides TaxID=1521621 RepID=UPI001687610E|nr:hypothetical protein [Nostoc parmelioides]